MKEKKLERLRARQAEVKKVLTFKVIQKSLVRLSVLALVTMLVLFVFLNKKAQEAADSITYNKTIANKRLEIPEGLQIHEIKSEEYVFIDDYLVSVKYDKDGGVYGEYSKHWDSTWFLWSTPEADFEYEQLKPIAVALGLISIVAFFVHITMDTGPGTLDSHRHLVNVYAKEIEDLEEEIKIKRSSGR